MAYKICDRCGFEIKEVLTPKSQHYGKLVCSNNKCNKWFKWIPFPENTTIRRKTSKIKMYQVSSFHNYDVDFCFFCLRKKEQLGENETLTLDHIEELSCGGKDEVENLQILCTACHKLKNWSRLYMNWHLNGENNG